MTFRYSWHVSIHLNFTKIFFYKGKNNFYNINFSLKNILRRDKNQRSLSLKTEDVIDILENSLEEELRNLKLIEIKKNLTYKIDDLNSDIYLDSKKNTFVKDNSFRSNLSLNNLNDSMALRYVNNMFIFIFYF